MACPEKKNKGKGKNVAVSTEIDEFASQFDKEFSFIANLATSVAPSSRIWYVDSGAPRHMPGARDQFTQFSERRLNLEVELGDERIVRAVGVGTVSFQRESLPPLAVSEILYVPGLKKNIISVSTIEDKGYEVTFRCGQLIMYPRGSSIESAKVIRLRHGKLYRFSFQPIGALVSSVEDSTQTTSDSRDLCELWHRRMAHLHHGALPILRQITTGVPEFSTEHYDICRGCTMGKYRKAPFPTRDSSTTSILDLVHTDVSGRMSHVSLRVSEYYVFFIDDFSRKNWISF